MGEGPGVRGVTGHFHLPVALHRSMKTRNDIILSPEMYSPAPVFTYAGQLLARGRLRGIKADSFTLDWYKPVLIFIKEDLPKHPVCHVQRL